ncbi:MAG: hypothetical protein UZ21_OP11001001018 [Microgenomates bacterium OLB22]|nr:MAG: hypothetical protein UZ21_OP11001001018 [Microgenomates bacterium OLB22]
MMMTQTTVPEVFQDIEFLLLSSQNFTVAAMPSELRSGGKAQGKR